MNKTPDIILVALLLAPLAALQAADAQPLRNANVSVDFDMKTGTYSLAMPARTAPVIHNSHATVEGWSSTDAGYQRKITSQSDDRLTIECARPAVPTLLLEFTLHPAFVELRTGLKNTTDKPVRIMKYWPLIDGVVFSGENWTDVRTLDAPSGANQPRVTSSAIRSSANIKQSQRKAPNQALQKTHERARALLSASVGHIN